MTVMEAIEALLKMPLDAELKIVFGDTAIPVDHLYHADPFGQNYVAID